MANSPILSLRLPPELRAKLEIIAEKEGRSLGDVIRRALQQYLKEQKNA
jgi:predicted transcriptional regulator